MIGLLHGVPIRSAPPAIRSRLAVSLSAQNWPDQVRAGLIGQPPSANTAVVGAYTIVQRPGVSGPNVIEITPRLEAVNYWLAGVPASVEIERFATGPAGMGLPPSSLLRTRGVAVRCSKARSGIWSVRWGRSPRRRLRSSGSPSIVDRICVGRKHPNGRYFIDVARPL